MPDWRAEVDHWWAGVLRVPVAAVRAGGVFALGHADHAGVVAAEGAAAPIVYGPARVLPALHAAVQASGGDLAGLAAALAPLASRVLGPAWYGYATARTHLARRQARPYARCANQTCRCSPPCMSEHPRPSGKKAAPQGCPHTATSITANCRPSPAWAAGTRCPPSACSPIHGRAAAGWPAWSSPQPPGKA
jgi:hypothetical protein